MGFGKPTKYVPHLLSAIERFPHASTNNRYIPIKLSDIRNAPNGDRIKAWDAAIEDASSEFSNRMVRNFFAHDFLVLTPL